MKIKTGGNKMKGKQESRIVTSQIEKEKRERERESNQQKRPVGASDSFVISFRVVRIWARDRRKAPR